MRSILIALASGLLIVVITASLAWEFLPRPVASVLIKMNNLSAGLSAKTVQTKMGDIHYLEGGAGETVVLIHGIYARKEHWVDLARHLVKDYHVIALDLPGFGDNQALPDDQYKLDQQRDNLLTVFKALDLQDVHVGANSMGAYVSVLLAQTNPDRVKTLAFIGSPLGVPTPIKSDMDLALERNDVVLLAKNEAEFNRRSEWLSPKKLYVPGPILKTWLAAEVAMAAKNNRIWENVHNLSDVPTVTKIAPDLSLETLIVWCREDRVFDISGAEILAAQLVKPTVAVLEGCGHVPMLDAPDAVADAYLGFLANAVPRTSLGY